MISKNSTFPLDSHQIDISVCIPTYNGASFLAETLSSVEEQEFLGRIEVIISDDASTDATLEIARNIAARSRYPYKFKEHRRLGVGANWDHSIASAQGKYIKLMMQDDIIYPHHLSRLFEVMEGDSRVGLAFSRRDILSNGEDYGHWIKKYGDLHNGWEQKLVTGRVSGRGLLKDRNFLSFPPNKIGEPSAVLLRRKAILETGGFSRTLKQSLDYEYWYRLLVRYDAYFIDDSLSAFRRHETQLTVQNAGATGENSEEARMLLYQSYFKNLILHMNMRDRARLCKQILKMNARKLSRS